MPARRNKKKTRRKNERRSSTLEARARSAEKRRQRAQRLRSIALAAVGIAGLAWLLLAGGAYLIRRIFTSNEHYLIRHLDIESDGRLTPELIAQYGGIETGLNIFAVDLDRIRAELENVPLVKGVEIRRSLPDTLALRVNERVPLARVSTRRSAYPMMLDDEGVLLGPARRARTLPTLSGLRSKKLKMGRMLDGKLTRDALEVLDLCDRTRLKQFIQIENIDISDAETMELRLRTGEYVVLPRRNIRSKLVDLANILNTSRRQNRRLAKIDMTVDRIAPALEYR